jgi:hypothetical protein
MSKNINQVYLANPSTSLPGTALIYAGLSPFGIGNDTAITVANFLLQVPSATWNDVTSGTQTLAVNQGYVTDNGASLITYTLPSTAAVGTIIEIVGMSSGLWTVAQNAGQSIHFGTKVTTVGGGGSLTATNQWDYVKLLCVMANTIFVVTGGVGNLTVV